MTTVNRTTDGHCSACAIERKPPPTLDPFAGVFVYGLARTRLDAPIKLCTEHYACYKAASAIVDEKQLSYMQSKSKAVAS